MLNYVIDKYEYQILPHNDWMDYPLFKSKICGVVTNSSDESLSIPIILDPEYKTIPQLPFPHLRGKSTKGLFKNEDYKVFPWLIIADSNDVLNLLNGDLNTIVALYHEIGHFHYSDEQNSEGGDEYRLSFLEKDEVSPDEIQADAFAVEKLGKEQVINSLNSIIIPFKLNPIIYINDDVKKSIREIELRIKYIKEKE